MRCGCAAEAGFLDQRAVISCGDALCHHVRRRCSASGRSLTRSATVFSRLRLDVFAPAILEDGRESLTVGSASNARPAVIVAIRADSAVSPLGCSRQMESMIASMVCVIRAECGVTSESCSDSPGSILIVDLELIGPSPHADPPVD
jgi:hypothetical protein